MSANATQVRPAEVATERPAWVERASATTTITATPLLPLDPIDATWRGQPRDLTLPSPSVERTAAVEREAYARGFTAGERAGRETAHARTEPMQARLEEAITGISALRTTMLRQAEQDVVQLALAIAHRIMQREIQTDRSALLELAQAALARLAVSAVVSIGLHPDDLAAIPQDRLDLISRGPVRLQADLQLPPGACRIQAPFGTIEAGLEAQLRELQRGLLDLDSSADDGGGDGSGVGE